VDLAVSHCFVSVCLPAGGPDCSFCIAEVSALLAVVFCVKISEQEQKTAADRAVSCRSIAACTKHVHCRLIAETCIARQTSHNIH